MDSMLGRKSWSFFSLQRFYFYCQVCEHVCVGWGGEQSPCREEMLFRTKTALASSRILWGQWKDPKEKPKCIDFRLEGPQVAPPCATSSVKTAVALFPSWPGNQEQPPCPMYWDQSSLSCVLRSVLPVLCTEISPLCPIVLMHCAKPPHPCVLC